MERTKKLLMIVLFIALAVILHPTTVLASVGGTFSTGGINYRVLTESETIGTVEVTAGDYSGYSSITIPATVENGGITYTVTSIGDFALYDCSGLTSIIIPDSVTSIGNYAFASCSSLTNIIIPNSVTSIAEATFASCSGLTSIIIPDSVTSIGNYAFASCSGLTSINIPDGVAFIGDSTFNECSSLTNINIPDSVTWIGNRAFMFCYNLTSINIPDSVTNIWEYAFSSCNSLTSINIPDSVTYMGDYAFDCISLTSIAFSGNVPPSFGADVFLNVPDGLLVIVPAGKASDYGAALSNKLPAKATIKEVVSLAAIQGVTAPVRGATPVTAITETAQYTGTVTWSPINNPFAASTTYTATITLTPKAGYTLTGVTKDFFTVSGATSVNNNAASGVITAVFPKTEAEPDTTINIATLGGVTAPVRNATPITAITETAQYTGTVTWSPNNNPFAASTTYTATITLTPKTGFTLTGVTEKFFTVSGATSVSNNTDSGVITAVFPATAGDTFITDGIQYKMLSETETTGTVEVIANNYSGSITIPETVENGGITYTITSIGDFAFIGCIHLTNINIPDSVTSIGEGAFYGCSGLTSISIPDSVTSIGNNAFMFCSGLTSISIPDSVTSIGRGEFFDCSGLTSISIPAGMTSIGQYMFYNCSKLTSISIPAGVTSIGDYVFYDCSKLASIAFSGSTPPSFGTNLFSSVPAGLQVSVPQGAAETYQTALVGKFPTDAVIIEVVSLAAIQGVTPPVRGEAPVSAITGTDQYTGTVIWTPVHNPFAASTTYTATITLTPKTGYTLTGVAKDFFTVPGATSVSNNTDSGVITTVFPATEAEPDTISIVAIGGVTAPARGATPVTAITETAQYTGTVTWSPNNNPFAASTTYTASITLTPKTGYTLTGVAADFFTVAGTTSVSNNAASGVITAVFPKTEAEPDTAISIAAIGGVTAPARGATPITAITETAQYTGTVTWSPNSNPFAASTTYTATITLTPKAGYTLTGVTKDSFTVSGATSVSNDINSGVITAVFPKTEAEPDTTINIAALGGVTVPVRGATPVTAITGTAQYTGTVTWSPNNNPFAASTTYTATITLTPKTGYTLTGVAKDFFTVSGATSVSNDINSSVITAVFPKTEAEPPIPVTVTSVTVKTASTKTSYIAGDPLDLTGLVVTLHKSDNTTEDVGFADFLTKGITVSPANATTLTTSNTAITITYTADNKSVSHSITVNKAPVVNSATINPATLNYDLNSPADIVTVITWNGASTVTDVVYGITSLTTPDVYAVSGSALTIKSSYLNTLGASKGSAVTLIISFDKGSSTTLTINMIDSNAPIEPTAYSIILQSSGNGSVSANVNSAAKDTWVTLIPTPDSGYRFKEWQVIDGGVMITDNKFTMPAGNVTVKAIFEQIPATGYQVAVNGSYAAASGAGSHTAGAIVTINAGSRDGYTFVGWTSVEGIILANANSATTTFTMPAGNVIVTASWSYNGSSGGSTGGNSGGSSGGSTGGNSGGNTTNTQSELIVNGTSVTVDGNSGYTATITADQISNKAVSKAVVTIGETAVSLPVGVLSDAIGDGTSLTLTQNELPASTLNAAKEAAEMTDGVALAVININLNRIMTSGTQEIHNLSDEVTVIITLTEKQAAEIKAGKQAYIYYFDPVTGTLSDTQAVFDLTAKTATFKSKHFSSYVLAVTGLPKPSVSGVTNHGVYGDNRKVIFENATAALDGKSIQCGDIVSREGSHSLLITDNYGTTETIQFVIDKSAPSIKLVNTNKKSVKNNGISDNNVTVTITDFSGVTKMVTRNGKAYAWPSKNIFTMDGKYVLTVKDELGKSIKLVFTIDKTAPVIVVKANKKGKAIRITEMNIVSKTVTLNGKKIAWPKNNIVTIKGLYVITVTDQAKHKTKYQFKLS